MEKHYLVNQNGAPLTVAPTTLQEAKQLKSHMALSFDVSEYKIGVIKDGRLRDVTNPDEIVKIKLEGRTPLAKAAIYNHILKPAYELDCCCCGGIAVGRQWWNRDSGYGLCASCVDFCGANVGIGETAQEYGVRGVHFDVVEGENDDN